MENKYKNGTPCLQTTVLPNYNCSNCKHFIVNSPITEVSLGFYAIECSNLVHPLKDCILRRFEGHSEQPGFSQTLNK